VRPIPTLFRDHVLRPVRLRSVDFNDGQQTASIIRLKRVGCARPGVNDEITSSLVFTLDLALEGGSRESNNRPFRRKGAALRFEEELATGRYKVSKFHAPILPSGDHSQPVFQGCLVLRSGTSTILVNEHWENKS